MVERGSGGRKSPSGVQGQSHGGDLGVVKPPEAIGTMKYYAYKTGFCLYFIAKTCTEIEKTGSFRDDVPC